MHIDQQKLSWPQVFGYKYNYILVIKVQVIVLQFQVQVLKSAFKYSSSTRPTASVKNVVLSLYTCSDYCCTFLHNCALKCPVVFVTIIVCNFVTTSTSSSWNFWCTVDGQWLWNHAPEAPTLSSVHLTLGDYQRFEKSFAYLVAKPVALHPSSVLRKTNLTVQRIPMPSNFCTTCSPDV